LRKLIAVPLWICMSALGLAAEKAPLGLPRSSPEEQGISSAAIQSFVETADQLIDGMNSFMLVRHGHVVAEGWWSPYDAATRHQMYSLSKSFTSTAVGMAVTEGRIKIDDPVLRYFPEDTPSEPSDNLKAMRVRDLLSMSTGQHAQATLTPDTRWTKAFLEQPVVHKPGTFFSYNTPATYMLSAIVQKATGLTVLDYLRPRLFEPLGIEDPIWPVSPQGITIGGSELRIRTEDIARFGQLYLRKGEWRGRRLLPAAWVEAATARQTSNGSNPDSDWEQGYGYQFWRCRHGFYRGDGAFGQFCIVMPEKDAVVAITSGVKEMKAVTQLVWDVLVPAMQAAPLAADARGRTKLKSTLAGLTLRPLQGSALAPSGASGRRYVFPANDQKLEAIALEVGAGDAVTLVARFGGIEQRIACGQGGWKKGRLAYAALPEQPVAASGAWTADGSYGVKISFYETPFYLTLGLRFSGDDLLYDAEYNVAFGPTKQPQLVGHAQ
jgi:CubicO group peptidase (beta-lactamase class C family)